MSLQLSYMQMGLLSTMGLQLHLYQERDLQSFDVHFPNLLCTFKIGKFLKLIEFSTQRFLMLVAMNIFGCRCQE